jgi:hypothetical protein
MHNELFKACLQNKIEDAAECLKNGIDPNTRLTNHNTPLKVASNKNLTEMVKLLLENGADPSKPETENSVFEITPLQAACKYDGTLETVHLLINWPITVARRIDALKKQLEDLKKQPEVHKTLLLLCNKTEKNKHLMMLLLCLKRLKISLPKQILCHCIMEKVVQTFKFKIENPLANQLMKSEEPIKTAQEIILKMITTKNNLITPIALATQPLKGPEKKDILNFLELCKTFITDKKTTKFITFLETSQKLIENQDQKLITAYLDDEKKKTMGFCIIL